MNLEKIRALKPGESLWDDAVKGLHVRATESGAKSFLFYYRTRDGRQRRPKIGELGEITVGEARARAKALSSRVAVGEDPSGSWQEKKEEMTVQELFEKTWMGYWAPQYSKSGWAKETKRLYTKELEPTFGGLKLSEVTPSKIRDWHRGYLELPIAGNRSLTVLSKMFNYAEEQEWRAQNSNPCNLVKAHPERKRKRFASEDEIAKIGALIEKRATTHPHGVAFLYLLMFSGSRPRAIENATWEQLREFELEGEPFGILTFQGKTSGKTGEEEQVILPPPAMRAIRRLPRIEGMTITGMKMPRRLWREIKKEAGCEDLWARDWRRTFATVGLSGGLDLGVIGELLNHKDPATTKIYAKIFGARKLEAATAISSRLEKMLGHTENRSPDPAFSGSATVLDMGVRKAAD